MCNTLKVSVSCKIEAGTPISFCFRVENPAKEQLGPKTMTVYSSDGNSFQDLRFALKLLDLPYATMNDPRPMYVRTPEFKMIEVEQTSPFPCDSNTLEIAFTTNVRFPLLSPFASCLMAVLELFLCFVCS